MLSYNKKWRMTMRVEKGEQGYICSRKRRDLIWLLAFVIIGIAIFLAGYFITKTRANIFTVLAVLMVLPGAKRVVALFVMIPRKSVPKDRYEKVKAAVGEGTLYTDYVFTSTEKIMHLDFLLVKNGNVLGVVASSKQDVPYMKKYITESVHKISSNFHVKIYDNDETFLKQVARLTHIEADAGQEKALLEFLHASIV